MMISPESFYDNEIKGKSAEEIKKVIAGLKRKINELKRRMEHPYYAPTRFPSEDTVISCYRLYIDRARLALKQMGESYEPSVTEKRDIEFNNNLQNVNKLVLELCDFTSWSTVTVKVGDTVRIITENTIPASPESCVDDNYEIERDDFLERLGELHMGEWLRHYDTKRFGIYVLDGYNWELTVEYNNGKRPFVRDGCNCHPYNFEKLIDTLGIDFSVYLN